MPPPSTGNIHETVPSQPVQTKAPVALNHTASFGSDVTVAAVHLAAIQGKAHGPGEISGPAVEIALRFTNHAAASIDLSDTVVTVQDQSGDPANELAGKPADPVNGSLAGHRSVTGRYVFTVAENERSPITIFVSYPDSAVVRLVGDVS